LFAKPTPFSVGGLPLLALRERTEVPELQPGSVRLLGLTPATVGFEHRRATDMDSNG
jgi:hypothetical protein